MKEISYTVEGLHCVSCELSIEKRLLEEKGIESVEASLDKNEVKIYYSGKKPKLSKLNKIFESEGYEFSRISSGISAFNYLTTDWLKITLISLTVIVAFLLLNKAGLTSIFNVTSSSTLPAFFIFGILAGFSTCSALVGGLILSMSKQWTEKHITIKTGYIPGLLFNVGRLVGYAFFGSILGVIGSAFSVSPLFSSVFIFVISLIMIMLALQMLGVKALERFKISMPKKITRYVAYENNLKGGFMPFAMGAASFFLPCGFTVTAQGLALLAGSPIYSSLIMFVFALGTMPALLLITFSSFKLSRSKRWSESFLKVAGILVIFFSLYNLNAQLNVLGIRSFANLDAPKSIDINEDDLPQIIDGKQVIRMTANSSGYGPSYFKVRANMPVRWEITDTGSSGCTNAVISRSLFPGEIKLTPGETSIREFTPTIPGRYKFSCWMGMVSGTIDVVEVEGVCDVSNSNEQDCE